MSVEETPVEATAPSLEVTDLGSPALPCPVVGIGASAGGLAAFEAFFSGMPADSDPGMAFVLVQHLAPDHKSVLTDLIQRHTRMKVLEVEDGMQVNANCVYIIAPNRDMAFINGKLQLLEPAEPRGRRLPIDFFFRSLAQDQHERAIGIVLSGTGSDGMLGVRAIKGEGGMVMAQTPTSCEFNGMPSSAISTGLVDLVMTPVEMPAQIIAYTKYAFTLPVLPPRHAKPFSDNALSKVFVLVRNQIGHDFSQYKPSTIHRRIERRMAVHQLDNVDDYVRYLQNNPAETEALFRDLLIGVTNFFRDPEAFASLEETVIPSLFEGKQPGAALRVWVPGCSTGEEAYSIAILLQEKMDALRQNYRIQIFGTDIDSQAIAVARTGMYPASIAADVTAQRLARFFSIEPGGQTYRIQKKIRDMLIFSTHDVIRDPPFSKVDLLSCRNVMIYMDLSLQKKLIPMFHYALNPNGIMFLGNSEGIGAYESAFTVLDSKAKLYRRRSDFQSPSRPEFRPPTTPTKPFELGDSRALRPVKLPLRELTERALLEQVAPAAALVNALGDIFYLHGRTGRYLEPAEGEVSINNILKMAREGLRYELGAALHQALSSKAPVRVSGLRVKLNQEVLGVNLLVRQVPMDPQQGEQAPLYLVVMEEAPVPPAPAVAAGQAPESPEASAQSDARVAELHHALQAKEQFLQAVNAQLETSNEQLKSSNEEMQSINEEFQASNEELETSREEMQSINEELATVNAELQAKVAELSRANNDMNNLLAGTEIATVFIDPQLHILRFTPKASQIIHLMPVDIGRPVAHLASNLVGYAQLVPDAQAVLDTLQPKEVTVQSQNGDWYLLRMLPYRTLENQVQGVVITFFNITQLKQQAAELKQAAEALYRLAVVLRDSHDAITVQDLAGQILAWNPGAQRLYGWTEAEALRMNVRQRIPAGHQDEELAKVLQLSQAAVMEPYRSERLNQGGKSVPVSLIASALLNQTGEVYAIATTERLLEPTHD
jgi:two-component system CheB/CheR fusion protein